MSRKKRIRFVLWTAAVLCMAAIFLFSAEPADDSSQTSGPFVDIWIALFHPEYGELSPAEQFDVRENASFIVRKIAHFSIFAILGALLTFAFSVDLKLRRSACAAFLAGTLYAVSDELHQLAVPGRAGQVRDVLIDACGVLTGTLAAVALVSAVGAILKRKEKEDQPNGSDQRKTRTGV